MVFTTTRSTQKRPIWPIILLLIVVVIVVWLIWWLRTPEKNADTTSNTAQTQATRDTDTTEVKSLVSYTLPDGWSENVCSKAPNNVYVIPDEGASLDCNAKPSSPVKIYVDSGGTTSCQQLTPASNDGIKKHTCSSLSIGGHKTLKSLTEYSASNTYDTDTTIEDYYINTGKGIVAVEYTYTSDNMYQMGYDQLARSVRLKM
jgi:hypothetical protein